MKIQVNCSVKLKCKAFAFWLLSKVNSDRMLLTHSWKKLEKRVVLTANRSPSKEALRSLLKSPWTCLSTLSCVSVSLSDSLITFLFFLCVMPLWQCFAAVTSQLPLWSRTDSLSKNRATRIIVGETLKGEPHKAGCQSVSEKKERKIWNTGTNKVICKLHNFLEEK